jgi:hypothetical protein
VKFDAYAGIALTNIIHKSAVPIIAIMGGMCGSAATFIFNNVTSSNHSTK